MRRKPAGCKTPNRDAYSYTLTASDIKYMKTTLTKIDDMLMYYVNMPENRTGDLTVLGRNFDKLRELADMLDGIKVSIDNVAYI